MATKRKPKPWEPGGGASDEYEKAPKFKPPKKKKPPAGGTEVKSPGPGSMAEDVIGEIEGRNKGIVDKYGEPGSHSSKKKKKRR